MKNLFLLRGLPGSGKTTLGNIVAQHCFAADDYFMVGDEYCFDPSKLKTAHAFCQSRTRTMMGLGQDVAVSNTFTQKWEMQPYFDMAEEFGYTVHSIIVENRHGGKNVHGVPEEAITKMRNRFEVQLG